MVRNLKTTAVLVCETATDKQIPPSITLLPSPCSSPYATIPFFNTAKAAVPRLQGFDPASGSCSQWWMRVRTSPVLRWIEKIRPSIAPLVPLE